MNSFFRYIPFFSPAWIQQYGAILADEHLELLDGNIRYFQERLLIWEHPFFNEEIRIGREKSFHLFIHILEAGISDECKALQLQSIPFEHWLDILGQRLTSASLRDEQAIPPLCSVLTEACKQPFNSEITMSQRAWEKHAGRTDNPFWGEITGNNLQKQQKVMEKISYVLDHPTWWNVFFHYRHGPVFEVREKEGHGIRWSHDGKRLIGFLEKFI